MTDSAETKSKTEPQTSTIAKATEETQKSSIDRLADLIGSLAKSVESVNERLTKMESTKAMETPTDLPLKPQVEAEEDIGAKTTIPDKYQGKSRQAGIDDASPQDPPKTDQADLKMEQKSGFTTTTTPRPTGGIDVNKALAASGREPSPILKRFRELGYQEGLEQVAREIRKGAYHTEYQAWDGVSI